MRDIYKPKLKLNNPDHIRVSASSPGQQIYVSESVGHPGQYLWPDFNPYVNFTFISNHGYLLLASFKLGKEVADCAHAQINFSSVSCLSGMVELFSWKSFADSDQIFHHAQMIQYNILVISLFFTFSVI